MNRKDIKLGDVLAWMDRYTTNVHYQDATSHPVRIIDLDREVPTYSSSDKWKRNPTGTRSAVFGVRLEADLLTPTGPEFEVIPKNVSGLWYDLLERKMARAKTEREAAERQQTREAAAIAVHDQVGELSDPGLRRGMLVSRNHVSIDVVDLLNLIKAARTAALNEMEGTGGR
jgi:hypothetical protein